MLATRRACRDPECPCSACGRCSGLAAGPLSQPAERSAINSIAARHAASHSQRQQQPSLSSMSQPSTRRHSACQATAAASGRATLRDHDRTGPGLQAKARRGLRVSRSSRRGPPRWVRPLRPVPATMLICVAQLCLRPVQRPQKPDADGQTLRAWLSLAGFPRLQTTLALPNGACAETVECTPDILIFQACRVIHGQLMYASQHKRWSARRRREGGPEGRQSAAVPGRAPVGVRRRRGSGHRPPAASGW